MPLWWDGLLVQIVAEVDTQMQKTSDAITHKKKKKATFTDILEGVSDNPMAAPSKANHKVFVY